MNTWHTDDLCEISEGDDLHIAPLREDGVTYGTPTWIWSVAVDGELYVRAYNGTASRWYKAALRQKAGRITAAGLTMKVTFLQARDELGSRIDEAYKMKYGNSPYLASMISERARSATIAIRPCTATVESRLGRKGTR